MAVFHPLSSRPWVSGFLCRPTAAGADFAALIEYKSKANGPGEGPSSRGNVEEPSAGNAERAEDTEDAGVAANAAAEIIHGHGGIVG